MCGHGTVNFLASVLLADLRRVVTCIMEHSVKLLKYVEIRVKHCTAGDINGY